jgi:rod shape-determining protein MreD
MSQSRFSWLAVFLSFSFAAVMEVIVLPDTIRFLRPEWLVLILIYWLIRHPEKIGIVTGIFIGLLLDVMSGSYLGVHILSMSIVCYLVLTMHKRLKMFPVAQQSLVIFFIVSIQLMVVYTIRATLGSSESSMSYLWVALSSALLWPIILVSADRLLFALR